MNTRTAYDVDEQHTRGKILVPSLVQNNGIVSIVRFWDDPRIMLIWKVPTLLARGWTLKHFIDMRVFHHCANLFLNTKYIESWRPYCPSLIFPLSPRGCIQHFENLWSIEYMFISNFILYGAVGTDWGTWFTISVYRPSLKLMTNCVDFFIGYEMSRYSESNYKLLNIKLLSHSCQSSNSLVTSYKNCCLHLMFIGCYASYNIHYLHCMLIGCSYNINYLHCMFIANFIYHLLLVLYVHWSLHLAFITCTVRSLLTSYSAKLAQCILWNAVRTLKTCVPRLLHNMANLGNAIIIV